MLLEPRERYGKQEKEKQIESMKASLPAQIGLPASRLHRYRVPVLALPTVLVPPRLACPGLSWLVLAVLVSHCLHYREIPTVIRAVLLTGLGILEGQRSRAALADEKIVQRMMEFGAVSVIVLARQEAGNVYQV